MLLVQFPKHLELFFACSRTPFDPRLKVWSDKVEYLRVDGIVIPSHKVTPFNIVVECDFHCLGAKEPVAYATDVSSIIAYPVHICVGQLVLADKLVSKSVAACFILDD